MASGRGWQASRPAPVATDGATILSIAQLTEQVRTCLQGQFSAVWVAGEISDLACPASGHVYLTLKDGSAQLKAVIWKGTASRLRFPLADGQQVICQGEIDIYPPRGTYQLVVRQLEPRGEGALQAALRQLQARLAAEGLFAAERKRPIARFPQRIAVVTSPTGAAIRDFLEVARRRWNGTEILVVPTLVQGAEAAEQIAAAIATANRAAGTIDTLVVTRGGGSMEDLWCFNDERVVRAIHGSRIPVVSAIGHEIDVTLADLVADLRALTPSEAAERVLPSREELGRHLQQWQQRMSQSLMAGLHRARTALQGLAQRRVLRHPESLWTTRAQRLDEWEGRAHRAITTRHADNRAALDRLTGQLHALSPLAVLARGYSLSYDAASGQLVRDASDTQVGNALETRTAAARIVSRIESIASVPDPATDSGPGPHSAREQR